MKRVKLVSMAVLVAVAAVTSCDKNSTDALPELLNDSTLTQDVAMSSADAAMTALQAMQDNEIGVALPSISGAASSDPSFTRSVTCYDANNVVVAGCSPTSSVRKVVTHVTINGSRSGTQTVTGGRTITWTGAVHRVSDDTLRRVFNTANPPQETSRIHSDVAMAHDTTTFTDGTNSRLVAEAARDTIKGVTFNLPRTAPANKWPSAGVIIRLDSVHARVTMNGQSASRDVVRRVEIDFPADAQGNVVLKVNDKTCTLNLNTRQVTNCH